MKINSKDIPSIPSAWEYIIEQRCIRGYQDSIKYYEKRKELINKYPWGINKLYKHLKKERNQTLDKYHNFVGV